MERNEVLNFYLSDLRRSAKLSVEQVCACTKIQARFVEAIEAGDWNNVPSNTHLRAFSLAMAKASGGDETQASILVRRLLAATAPVEAPSAGGRGFDTPAPALSKQEALPRPNFNAGQGVLAAAGPAASLGAPMAASSLAAASLRLRSLPLSALLTLLALAGSLSYGAAWTMEHWRQRQVSAVLGSSSPTDAMGAGLKVPASSDAAPAAGPSVGIAGKASLPMGLPKSHAAAIAQPFQASAALGVSVPLTLRARRACWLVLEIDGKRLPTITLQDGEKLTWPVAQRAVLLAGNVGALRVWWQGDGQGYLGELDQRANAMVFERGHRPRLDASAALSLPVGIPQ